jgi:two-component system response regulator TctD
VGLPFKRILLVEDEAHVLFMLTHVLTAEHYIVDAAASVAGAEACLATKRYDVAICDWRLPDGDGLPSPTEPLSLGQRPS